MKKHIITVNLEPVSREVAIEALEMIIDQLKGGCSGGAHYAPEVNYSWKSDLKSSR